MKKDKVEEPMSPETDPKLEKEVQAYLTGLSKMIHGKETRNQVLEMLKAAPPEQAIPNAALTINSQMEGALREKGKPPSLEVLLSAGVFLVSDLVEIGNAANVFQLDEEGTVPILQSTLQQYIEKGLAEGTIDPVELQQKVEPLMDEEYRALGNEAAPRAGLPEAPNEMTAMNSYGAKMERKGAMKGGM